MKINELMIGDWVKVPPELNRYKRIRSTFDMDSAVLYEPIPLTTEILEKNGFYYDEDRNAYLLGVIFQVEPEGCGLFSLNVCGCPYPLSAVHELQHALKLCRIIKEIEL